MPITRRDRVRVTELHAVEGVPSIDDIPPVLGDAMRHAARQYLKYAPGRPAGEAGSGRAGRRTRAASVQHPRSALMADDTAPDGKIVTFYSYKGGTGRTMALANVAWILAGNGYKVLAVDWDLEAPGLHRSSTRSSTRSWATPGLIDLITDYAGRPPGSRPAEPTGTASTPGSCPHAISLNWNFPEAAPWTSSPRAGRTATTPSSVTAIDWDNFYDRFGGGQFFDALRDDMKRTTTTR